VKRNSANGESSIEEDRPHFIKGWPLLGQLPALAKDIIGSLRRFAKQDVRPVEFKIMTSNAYLVSSPDGVKEVLTRGEPEFTKGLLTSSMKAAFGDSLALENGAEWRRKRKLLQPLFLKKSVQSWRPIIVKQIELFIERWRRRVEQSQAVNIKPEANQLILNIMTEIMFGEDMSPESAKMAGEAVNDINEALFGVFCRNFFFGGSFQNSRIAQGKKFRDALKKFNGIVDATLAFGFAQSSSRLIDQFRLAKSSEGDHLSEKEIRDEATAFFFAGLETTSNALVWAFYYLALHPQFADRIASEASKLTCLNSPTFDETAQLPFTYAFILEVLRMKAPAYALERRTSGETNPVQGCPLKQNATIILSPAVTHRDEEYWEEPDNFCPDRFNTENASQRPQFAFFPFGGGARKCIGMHLAIMELVMTIAKCSQNFEFKFVDDSIVRDKVGVTLMPDRDFQLILRRRRSA